MDSFSSPLKLKMSENDVVKRSEFVIVDQRIAQYKSYY